MMNHPEGLTLSEGLVQRKEIILEQTLAVTVQGKPNDVMELLCTGIVVHCLQSVVLLNDAGNAPQANAVMLGVSFPGKKAAASIGNRRHIAGIYHRYQQRIVLFGNRQFNRPIL